jgi:hypothetical protein
LFPQLGWAIRKPWYKKQSKSWVVTLPGGKVKTLGRDPHGATRKNPPREIVEAWHALSRVRKPKDMLFADVADLYVGQLSHPKTKATAREQLDWFLAFAGRKIKVSELRVHDVNEYLRKTTWSASSKATAVSCILAALDFAVNEGLIESHAVKFARGKRPKVERRDTQITDEHQRKLEAAANPELRAVLVALRESGAGRGRYAT